MEQSKQQKGVWGSMKGSTLAHIYLALKTNGIRLVYIAGQMGWILINDLATLVSIVDFNTFLNLNSFFFF